MSCRMCGLLRFLPASDDVLGNMRQALQALGRDAIILVQRPAADAQLLRVEKRCCTQACSSQCMQVVFISIRSRLGEPVVRTGVVADAHFLLAAERKKVVAASRQL